MTSPSRPIRVGLFGLLGSGNLGNDGSLEAMLAFLRRDHPNAELACLCAGPERVTALYGIPATRLHWYQPGKQTVRVTTIARKTLGKLLDAIRTWQWVRRFDVVIVPGMGILETTLPLRPWGFPYALFLLCVAGRLSGTKVALVSVGANVISTRATRRLVTWSARLTHYRSYRDELSYNAMRQMGVDTANDPIYPDLAFALPQPSGSGQTGKLVGVGVMAYYGGVGDRRHAKEIHRSYVTRMTRFVRWLLDHDHRVRLFTGDQVDDTVVAEIIAEVRKSHGATESQIAAASTASLSDLMREMAEVDTVVATRYHNVLCALKLAKPTLSIGYATKNDVLMAEMGLSAFCQSIRSLDVERLIEQFRALDSQRGHLARMLTDRGTERAQRLEDQFGRLSSTLLSRDIRQPTAARGSQG